MLRHYNRQDVLETVLSCLDEDDFAVRYAARDTLRKITGRDHGYDVQAAPASHPRGQGGGV